MPLDNFLVDLMGSSALQALAPVLEARMQPLVMMLMPALGDAEVCTAMEVLASGGINFTALNVPAAQIALGNIRCAYAEKHLHVPACYL